MKRLFKIIGALLALLIIAAFAIPMFISADFIKAQLIAQVKTATGRDLTINGAASIKIFPNIAVEVEDATLGNPAGFSTPYLVHVKKLETGAALKPLLSKELRITGFTLEGADVQLEQLGNGTKNWEFKNAKPVNAEAAASPPTKEPSASSPLKALAIGRVTIKDSKVTLTKPGAKPMAVEGITLALDGADFSGPLALDGKLRYQGGDVSIKLNATDAPALKAGKPAPLKATISVPSGEANFDGKLTLAETPIAQGATSLSSDNLPALMGWATGKKPAGKLPQKVSAKTNLTYKGPQSIALNDLNVSADSITATGNLLANVAGVVPNISGELKLSELDLDKLAAHQEANTRHFALGASPAYAAEAEGWSTAAIDASALRAANANLKLSSPKITSGKLTLSNIATTLMLNAGKLNMNISNISLYGGTAKGIVNLDGTGSGVGLAANLALNQIDIEGLMTALTGASKLKGAANITMDITSHGASQRALIGALNGMGVIRINNGAIKGINIASFLRDAKKGFLLAESSTESTDFTELTGSYKIAQGVLSNSDLLMKSPVLRLTGSGTVNLPAKTINYRAVPSIVGTLKGQGGKDKLSGGGLDIPLIITGPWSRISVTPDVKGLVEDALKNPEALKQNLKDIGSDLKNFNSPKDIGKALLGGKKAEPATPTPEGAAPATPADAAAPATDAAAPEPAPAKKPKLKDAVGDLLKGF